MPLYSVLIPRFVLLQIFLKGHWQSWGQSMCFGNWIKYEIISVLVLLFPVNGKHSDLSSPRWDLMWVMQNHCPVHLLHNSRLSPVWQRPQEFTGFILQYQAWNSSTHRWNFCPDCLSLAECRESIPYLNNKQLASAMLVWQGDTLH